MDVRGDVILAVDAYHEVSHASKQSSTLPPSKEMLISSAVAKSRRFVNKLLNFRVTLC